MLRREEVAEPFSVTDGSCNSGELLVTSLTRASSSHFPGSLVPSSWPGNSPTRAIIKLLNPTAFRRNFQPNLRHPRLQRIDRCLRNRLPKFLSRSRNEKSRLPETLFPLLSKDLECFPIERCFGSLCSILSLSLHCSASRFGDSPDFP